jgi:hypothetical protein
MIGLLLAIVVATSSFVLALQPVLLITIPVTLGPFADRDARARPHAEHHDACVLAAAVGLIIDDAIVVTEQLHRTHEEHPDAPRGNIGGSVRFLLPAMVASSLSTIVIFLPLGALSGVAGAYFKVSDGHDDHHVGVFVFGDLDRSAGGVSAAIAGSVDPSVDKPVQPSGGHWVRWFIRKPWLSFGFGDRQPRLLRRAQHLETGLPEMDEGSTWTILRRPALLLRKRTACCARPRRPCRRAGIQAIAAAPARRWASSSLNPTTATTDPIEEGPEAQHHEAIDDIRHRFEVSQPALRIDFGRIGDMLGDLMSSVQPIEIEVFGNDQHQLQALAKKVARVVEGVGHCGRSTGTRSPDLPWTSARTIKPLARRGLTPQGLNDQPHHATARHQRGAGLRTELVTPVRMVLSTRRHTSLSDGAGASSFPAELWSRHRRSRASA